MKTTIRTWKLDQPLSVADLQGLTEFACYFETEADAEAFFKLLPKSVKANRQGLQRYGKDDYDCGLRWIATDKPEVFSAPVVRLRISELNRTTGERNEAGIARRARFIAAIEKNCEVVDAL